MKTKSADQSGQRFELTDPKRVYVPGDLVPKLIYLLLSIAVFCLGAWFAWEPARAMLFGKIESARVSEIHELIPGEAPRIYRYRRTYTESDDFRTIYQHYVSVSVDGAPTRFRLSVDSRRQPAPEVNVNDTITVAYLPDDPRQLAFQIANPRTWGAAALFAALGAVMLATSIPMLWAVGKPIPLDPEAPPSEAPPGSDLDPEAGRKSDDPDEKLQKRN